MDNENKNPEEKSIVDKTRDILNDVEDSSSSFDKKEIDDGKALAIISYIGFLAVVAYLVEKNNKFVIYHAKQGLNLFIVELIGAVAIGILGMLAFFFIGLVSIISFVFWACAISLSVIGIVNVFNGKAKELPLINKVKIIK